jgi:cobalt-zinc-cadmium efflux system protein
LIQSTQTFDRIGGKSGIIDPMSSAAQSSEPKDGRRVERALIIAVVLNSALALGQILVGFVTHSLAVAADAAHQFVDVLALVISLVSLRAVSRSPSTKRTYGLRRGDSLGAHTSSILLLLSVGWIAIEAIKRLVHPEAVQPFPMIVVGAIGLVINGSSALLLARSGAGHNHGHGNGHGHVDNSGEAHHHGEDHTESHAESLGARAAQLHLITDAAGSLLVLLTGVVMAVRRVDRLDPIASLLLCALVVGPAVRLLRQSGNVLLDSVPETLNLESVSQSIAKTEGVVSVHHVHVWSLGLGAHALSAHIELDGEATIHDGQLVIDCVSSMLSESFSIRHATLQIECHPCLDPVHS